MIPFPDVCRDCIPPRRCLNCHSCCPDYLEAKAKHDAEAAEDYRRRQQERDADAAAFKLRRS